MKNWKRFIKWIFIGWGGALLIFGRSAVLYRAEASFKEELERITSKEIFQGILGEILPETKPQAASIMKSNRVLRPLIERLGIQIHQIETKSWISRFFNRYLETFQAEKGVALPDFDPFVFENVRYVGEKNLLFCIQQQTEDQFLVFDASQKKILAKGRLKEPLDLRQFTFTLKSFPKKVKTGHLYPFRINHWSKEMEILRDLVQIEIDQNNPSIVEISLLHRDRHWAAQLINELMEEYQSYLKKDYDCVAKEQLAYLEKKQNQVFSKIENLFNEHSFYLKKNLVENGFIGLEQENQNFLIPYQEMFNKVQRIDIEIIHINQVLKSEKTATLIEGREPFSSKVNQALQTIYDLKQQKDLLELFFFKKELQSPKIKQEQLKEVRDLQFEVGRLLRRVELGGEISSFDFHEDLRQWANAIQNSEERSDFAKYLVNYSRMLSMQEKILKERFFYNEQVPKELEGIDLQSARELFLDYNTKLDQSNASLNHFNQLKKQVFNPHFDLVSLSCVLMDPLSQQLIEDASHFELLMKDEKHHSKKEREKWTQEIALSRNILSDHLDQLSLVEKLNIELFRKKMGGLQRATLDGINCKISVLNEQLNDYLKNRKVSLELEKGILEKRMQQLRGFFARALPEKWRFEKLLSLKTEIATKIMETITDVVESRTISSQMHYVASKPLDFCLTPISPRNPHLFLTACLGAFALPLFVFCSLFLKQAFKGFPISLEKLEVLKLSTLGAISPFCDGPFVEKPTGSDLNLLRKIALFSVGAKVIGLIGGKGPDYTYALAENLVRSHLKSIVVRCDFLNTFRKEDGLGVLQFCEGAIDSIPIQTKRGFDWISAGGFSPFGMEIIQSKQFSALIESLKRRYDLVFLFFCSSLSSIESIAALQLCDRAVVTLCAEKIEILTPFIEWGYSEKHCRLTFIARS